MSNHTLSDAIQVSTAGYCSFRGISRLVHVAAGAGLTTGAGSGSGGGIGADATTGSSLVGLLGVGVGTLERGASDVISRGGGIGAEATGEGEQ